MDNIKPNTPTYTLFLGESPNPIFANVMLRPELDWSLCQICQPCMSQSVCKVRAILRIDPDEAPYIDLGRCNGCGNCITACAHQAIIMKTNTRKTKTTRE